MSDADRVLVDLARGFDGVIPRALAHEHGLTDRQLRRRTDNGMLRRVRPGLYVHRATSPTPRQAMRLAVVGSGGVLSHRSAAHFHGLLHQAPGRPEVTVPVGRRYRDEQVLAHRHDVLDDCDVACIDGLLVTTPVRTLVDIGTKVTFVTLNRAAERGLRLSLFTMDDVAAARRRLARRGRDGVGPVATLLDHRSADLVATDSDLEQLLWEIIERFDLPTPRRQVEVVVDGHRFVLDQAYPERRIALEGDGYGVHTERRAFEKDRFRQNRLLLAGWIVLRFTWEQLTGDPGHVARTIRAALDRRPLPGPVS